VRLRRASGLAVSVLLLAGGLSALPAAAQQAGPTYAAPTARDAQPRPDDQPVATSPVDVANPCDRTVVRPALADGTTCMYPWPNNLYTTGTGADRRLNLPLLGMPKNAAGKPINPLPYADSDGFSPGQMLIVPVPGLDNPEAFARTGSVPITDMGRYLAPDAPVVVIDVQTGKRHPIWTEIDVNPLGPLPQGSGAGEVVEAAEDQLGQDLEPLPTGAPRPTNTANVNFLIRPAVNFENGHRYVVGMRTLRDRTGAVLPPTRGFRLYRDRSPLVAADPRTERYEKDVFPVLEEAGFARGDLYQAWDFSVASAENIAGRLLHLRDDSFAQLGDTTMADRVVQGRAPTFTVDAPTVDEATGVRTITGTFTVPCYIDTPRCAPGGQFQYADPERMEPLQLPGNVTVPSFTCKVPKEVYDSPELVKVRPSLYGHGLLGGQGEVGQGQVRDMITEHRFMYCATDWEGFATTDIPTVAQALVDMDRFPAVIDHTQQGELNFLHLARLMVHPQGFAANPAFQVAKGGAAPQTFIDTRRAFYDGNSQGGIYGGTVMAVAPDVDAGVLGVPGINYSTLLRRSVDFALYSLPLYTVYPSEYERPLLLSVIQILWDRGDPNGYVNALRPGSELPDTHPHRVMYQPGYGDHQVAIVSAEVAARSVGAAVDRNALEPGRTPDVEPLWGVPKIAQYPYRGSAFVYFDTGPFTADNPRGTPAPPTTNVPPVEGTDPHEAPRRSVCGRILKSDFLRLDGFVGRPCQGAPYFAFDYKGRDGQPGQGDTPVEGDLVPLGQEPAAPADPSPSPSASSSPSSSPSASSSPSSSPEPSASASSSPSGSPSTSPSASPSSAPAATPTASPTVTPSVSPSPTASASPRPTASPSASASPSPTASPSPSTPPVSRTGGGYHALQPARLLDTRTDGGPVAAGADREVSVLGRAGVPREGVRAVVVNATVTGVPNGMDLQVYPVGDRPARRTSNLNAGAGETVANLVTTAVGDDGRIALSVSQDSAHVVLDVLGWYDDGSVTPGDGYVPLVPERRFDSRQSTPVAAGQDRTVTVAPDAPAGTSAVVVSVTALSTPGDADVALYPAGQRPSRRTSTLNLRQGDTVANLAVVPVDRSGRITVSVSSGSAQVVLDLLGYYGSGSDLVFEPSGPRRSYDSRTADDRLAAGEELVLPVTGRAGVPDDGVAAVLLNLTSVGSTTAADLQVHPTGSRPARRTSNLNVRPGQTRAVAVLAAVGDDGSVSVTTSQGSTHVVADVLGYVRSGSRS
jgi:hypothetical protein